MVTQSRGRFMFVFMRTYIYAKAVVNLRSPRGHDVGEHATDEHVDDVELEVVEVVVTVYLELEGVGLGQVCRDNGVHVAVFVRVFYVKL